MGVLLGMILGPSAGVLEPLGTLFLRLLQMVVFPLVLCTLVVGAATIHPARLGRVGGKTLALYLLTSLFAIVVGIALALLVQPGAGLANPGEPYQAPPPPSWLDLFLGMVPINPFAALTGTQILPVVFFALLVGLALASLQFGPEGRARELAGDLLRIFEAGAEVIFVIVKGVLEYAPIGVAALIAVTVGELGGGALWSLLRMVVVIYGAIALQFVVYTLLLRAFRVSPRSFFVGIQEAILTAFVTRSSNATLPVAMRSAERVGVSESIYGFTLPLGAVVNSDGAAIYMGATVVFVANILGLDLSITQLVGVVITGVLVSLGTAGVPSGGLLMVTIALTQLGLPLEPLALIAGIDAVLDMARTVCNVTGDLVVTKMVAQTEPDLPGDAIQPSLD